MYASSHTPSQCPALTTFASEYHLRRELRHSKRPAFLSRKGHANPPSCERSFSISLHSLINDSSLQIPETEEAARKRQNIARALEFERRVHRLQNVILVSMLHLSPLLCLMIWCRILLKA